MKILSKQQAGETIVEVLISILVISVALSGAFAISNRSQKTVQANQERYQAQILANSQADLLKNYVSNNPRPTNPSFCINSSGVPSTTDSDCDNQGANQLYDISITCGTSPCVSDQYSVYKITVTWDSLINNGGQDNVELWYGV
jgi:Tfp pilus assembly protein PilV